MNLRYVLSALILLVASSGFAFGFDKDGEGRKVVNSIPNFSELSYNTLLNKYGHGSEKYATDQNCHMWKFLDMDGDGDGGTILDLHKLTLLGNLQIGIKVGDSKELSDFDFNGDGEINLGDRDDWCQVKSEQLSHDKGPLEYALSACIVGGDVDGDGNVIQGTDDEDGFTAKSGSVNDEAVVRSNMFKSGDKGWMDGNFDGDRSVDVRDWNIWNSHRTFFRSVYDIDGDGVVHREDRLALVVGIMFFDATSFPECDVNADGKLDSQDYLDFLKGAGIGNGLSSPEGYALADIDLDGQVDQNDLQICIDNQNSFAYLPKDGNIDAVLSPSGSYNFRVDKIDLALLLSQMFTDQR